MFPNAAHNHNAEEEESDGQQATEKVHRMLLLGLIQRPQEKGHIYSKKQRCQYKLP